MNGCLGIYVGDKVVKYAMLSKDPEDRIGVESVGTKFITSTKEDVIREIIQETGSTYPISFNLKNETYENVSLISKLSKADMAKVIEIEFEDLCEKKGTNPKLFDKRYMVTEEDKTGENNILLVRSTKAQIEDIKNSAKANVAGIFPSQICITDLVAPSESNYIILNLEEQTQIITVIKGKIIKLSTLNLGLSTILDKLSYELNSFTKAYDVCKSLNVYGDSSSVAAPEFEKIVEPILQDIIHRFEAQIIEYRNDIKKIFISGTGPMFANLDRLFEEYFQIKTELLKPHFLPPSSIASNLGQILESNSAISLAYEILEPSNTKTLNFSNGFKTPINIQDKMKEIFGGIKLGGKKEIGLPSKKNKVEFQKPEKEPVVPMQQTVDLTAKPIEDTTIEAATAATAGTITGAAEAVPTPPPGIPTLSNDDDENGGLPNVAAPKKEEIDPELILPGQNIAAAENAEMEEIREERGKKGKQQVSSIEKFRILVTNLTVIVGVAVFVYVAVGIFFDKNIMSAKEVYLSKVKDINSNISKINEDANYVEQATSEYAKINEYISSTTSLIEHEKIGKYTTNNIAKFLQELMNIMPKNAVLTNIKTDTTKQVTITAKSVTYSDLGYLVSRLKLDGTLKNIKIKNIVHGTEIQIEIGGELP